MTGPARAMVLAAGRGERMRPLTETLPKPLIEVAGISLVDRVLAHLAAAGVESAIVNTHYLAAQIEERLAGRQAPGVEISHESELLDTGGGVANALPLLGAAPFFVVNSDALWTDGAAPTLRRLAASWDETLMDALLLVVPVAEAWGYDGKGDYEVAASGRLASRNGAAAPFVFAGVQILHPRLFAGVAVAPFSLKRLYDRAEDAGRLHGLVHDGAWFHVGTPAALTLAETRLAALP
ncbi:MAG: nucleotidyltransferase family protein [Alphaproteobacteria bacterium]|nr:nucleotidyltransferase family protein [Alphaproteobacteria bacterium]